MKNLLNCHVIGLHSFPISFENNLYKRIFYADTNHELHKPVVVAIHPHHVDITITVLEGELYNPLYKISNDGQLYKMFKWNSHILNGNGGFEYRGHEKLTELSNLRHHSGDVIKMKACELHTIQIEKEKQCIWLIEESMPTCDYFPINYSPYDLTKWTPEGLYREVDDNVKQQYIGKYLNLITS